MRAYNIQNTHIQAMAELLPFIFLFLENKSFPRVNGCGPRPGAGDAACTFTVKQELFYGSVNYTVDNLLLTYNVENQNRQQCQQIRCKRQVIVGSEL